MEGLLSFYRSVPIGVDNNLLMIGMWVTIILFALPATISVALWMAKRAELGRAVYVHERFKARLEMLEQEKARERIRELKRSGEWQKISDEERKKRAA